MTTQLEQSINRFILNEKRADTLMNGGPKEVVTTSSGSVYPTFHNAVMQMIETGGFEPFATEVLLKASVPTVSKKAAKALDTKKIWLWTRTSAEGVTPITGTWVDTGLSDLDQMRKLTGVHLFENLVNPNQATQQGYFSGASIISGTSGYLNYYIGLDYYPVTVGQKIWLKGVSGGQVIQLYRADKTAIWHVHSSAIIDGVYTIPESIPGVAGTPAFIRIGTDKGETAFSRGLIGLGYGSVSPEKNPVFSEDYIELASDAFNTAISDVVVVQKESEIREIAKSESETEISKRITSFENLVNPNQATQQGYFDGKGITTSETSFQNYRVGHDYYKAKVGDKFWFYNVARIQLYRADKTAIWSVRTQASENGFALFEIPSTTGSVSLAECEFIRIETSKGINTFLDANIGVGYGNFLPSTLPVYGSAFYEASETLLSSLKTQLVTPDSPLKDKKWVALGDSITNHSNCYAKVLTDRHGAKLIKHSRDGARIHRESSESTFLVLAEEYLNIDTVNPPSIITIAGGTNDTVTPEQLGSFSDRTVNTFYGALHVLLSGLRSRFLDSRIGFIAPTPKSSRYIDGDLTNAAYLKYKAIKEVCAYYSVPVWNGNTEFGASPLDSSAWKEKYMADGLHPTILGHVWYANRVEDFVMALAK